MKSRLIALFSLLGMLSGAPFAYAQPAAKATSATASHAVWIWRDNNDPAPKNAFTYFRKKAYLKRVPGDATLHFAADSNAHLWVNGHILQRKMTRYFESSIRTMVLDPKPYLHPGWNTIVVLHHSWGPIITFQRSAAVHAGLYLRSSWVNSDSSWTVQPAPEFEKEEQQILGVTGDQRIRYPEVINGAQVEDGLFTDQFDDSKWQHAVVVENGPWTASPQDVETAPQEETSVSPQRIIAAGTLQRNGPIAAHAIDIAATISKASYTPDQQMKSSASQLLQGGSFSIHGKGGESKYILVDFGLPVHGFPELRLSASAEGTVLDLGYAELAYSQYTGKRYVRADGWIDPEKVVGHGYADRYRTRAGEQRVEMPDERTARWFSVLVHFQQDSEISFSHIGFVRSIYPVKDIGSFSSGDAEIDKIMQLAMRHARVSMSDVYVDTPGREDGMWIEDARPRAELSARWFGDTNLRHLFLRLIAESQKSNGNFHPFPPASYPMSPEGLLDWTVEWAGALYDEYQWTGNVEDVNAYWPQLTRLWTLLLSRMDANGIWRSRQVLADLRVGEHAKDDSESSSIVSAQMIARLRESIQLARDTHHAKEEAQWTEALQKMQDAFRKDHIVAEKDGIPAHVPDVIAGNPSAIQARGFSQAAQAMAGLAELIPQDQFAADLTYAFTEPDGSPHPGVTRWNNPTYAYRVLRVLSDAGRADLAVRHFRERYAAYLAGNPRNHIEPELQGDLGGPLPEYFVSRDDLGLKEGELDTAQPVDETGSHGWASVPLLWAHDTLLGVRIARAGGAELNIAPNDGGLPYVSGTTVTPHGPVKVDWRPSVHKLTIQVPAGIAIHVTLPGGLNSSNLTEIPAGCTAADARMVTCSGKHTSYSFTAKRNDHP